MLLVVFSHIIPWLWHQTYLLYNEKYFPDDHLSYIARVLTWMAWKMRSSTSSKAHDWSDLKGGHNKERRAILWIIHEFEHNTCEKNSPNHPSPQAELPQLRWSVWEWHCGHYRRHTSRDGGYSREEPGRPLSHICPGPCAAFSCRCQRGYPWYRLAPIGKIGKISNFGEL